MSDYSFKTEETFEVQKDDGGHYVIALAYRPGDQFSKDRQGDWMRGEQVERMAERYVETGTMTVKRDHDEVLSPHAARVVQAYIAPTPLSIGGRTVPKGSFVMKIRLLSEELVTAVRRKELTGLSISGRSHRSENGELSDVTLNEVSLVTRPAMADATFLVAKEQPLSPAELENGLRAIRDELAQVNEMLREETEEAPSKPKRLETFEEIEARENEYQNSPLAAARNAREEAAHMARRRERGFRSI